jgi:hypothetical protein
MIEDIATYQLSEIQDNDKGWIYRSNPVQALQY